MIRLIALLAVVLFSVPAYAGWLGDAVKGAIEGIGGKAVDRATNTNSTEPEKSQREVEPLQKSEPLQGAESSQMSEPSPKSESLPNNRPDERIQSAKPEGAKARPTQTLSKDAAYVLVGRLWKAHTEKEASDVIYDLFKTIGLGVYAPDGRAILRGSERNKDDFFVYDFQVDILARAFIKRNGMPFQQYAEALERNIQLAGDKGQIPFSRNLLIKGLRARYKQAADRPTDPHSFLTLVVDGLARRHMTRYSLDVIGDNGPKPQFLDPIQTFLITLDIFAKPVRPADQASLRSTIAGWHLVGMAWADSPCDAISGDPEKEGYFGTFLSIVQNTLGSDLLNIGGKVTKILGHINNAVQPVQFAIMKYAFTLSLTAEPKKLHLHHQGEEWKVLTITAKADFDPGRVPEDAIKCGWLAGASFPPKGPMADVPVEWTFYPASVKDFFVAHPEMNKWTHGANWTKTDRNGQSEFKFLPLECKDKKGTLKKRNFRASANAKLLSNDPLTVFFNWQSSSIEYASSWFGGLFSAETVFAGERHEKSGRGYTAKGRGYTAK